MPIVAPKKKKKCTKRVYSLEEATRLVLRANANGGRYEGGKRPLRSYFCYRCSGYHLTSKEYGYPG
jgi:hypothetical protein